MPESNINPEDVFTTFLDRMITEKNGPEMSLEERWELIKTLRAELDERIDDEMVNALSDEKAAELNTLMQKGMTDAQLEEFLKTSGANFEEATLKAMEDLRKDYLGIKDEENTMTTTNGEGEEK